MTIGTYRSPILVLLLCFVTCGLYYFYYMYAVTDEVNRYTGRNEQSPMGDIFLTILTCGAWDIYWDYRIGKRTADMCRSAGITPIDNAVLYVVLDVVGVGLLNVYFQQDLLNKVWAARPPYGGSDYQAPHPDAYPPPPGPYYQ